jgi:hypothetical protein
MEYQIKEDWLINNQNIFGFRKDISLSISSIQYEINNQLEGKKISSISNYLDADIDINKEVRYTQSLTILSILEDFLDFKDFNPLKTRTSKCSLILSYLQLSLFKEYINESNKNILTFSEYENQYNELLKNYLTENIDTDEQDFIKDELKLCNSLVTELSKPIYNKLGILSEVLDKPCKFKKNLLNSIDKRKKFLEQKKNEKYPKVKALFQFIKHLHSNIDNFNQYNDLIQELEKLDKERNKLNPKNNYKDKLKYDEVQTAIESKFKILQDNTANLIKAKAKELNVCNFDNEPDYSFNGVEAEIHNLKENFSNKDLPEIFKHKSLYLEYRTNTHKTFLSLQFFFDELDEIAKDLFDYFKDTKQNEFEPFEIKAIPANNWNEVVKLFQAGHKKIILPDINSLITSNIEQPKNEVLPPQTNAKKNLELNEVLSKQITHPKREEISKAIKDKFSSYKGKDFKILYEALLKLNLFPSKRKRSTFFRCLRNEGYNINSIQMLEDKYFQTGHNNSKGIYQKSEDEIQCEKIMEFLESVIKPK